MKNYDQQLKAAIPALKDWVALAAGREFPPVPNVPGHPLNSNGAATGLYNGMIHGTDITTLSDIHPPNKQDVGRRLALWALARTYGQKVVIYSGPLYESMSDDLERVVIKFKHNEGLKSRDDAPLTWFTIAGEDKKFHKANAEIKGETVIVSSPAVAKPVAVRFGWSQLAEPNLVNKAGLPASPFRTDN